MPRTTDRIITGMARMWPRAVFEMKVQGKHPVEIKDLLHSPGVYVLYREDRPYYIGKTAKNLWHRIWTHANKPKDRYYNFWNYFSAFQVPDPQHLDDIEGVLIASTPSENSAVRAIPLIHIPVKVAQQLHAARTNRVYSGENDA